MYRFLSVGLLISVLFISSTYLPQGDSNELIRRKVENIAFAPGLTCGQTLQCTKSIVAFYQENDFSLSWERKTSAQLMDALRKSGAEGLNPADYHYEQLKAFFDKAPTTIVLKAEYDMLQTDAYLLYASHLLSGKVNPVTIDPEWHVVRREGDPLESLKKAMSDGAIERNIQSLLPRHKGYQTLKATLARLTSVPTTAWPPIETGATLKLGNMDMRVVDIRERLIQLGDFPAASNSKGTVYSEDLQAAIVRFQKRHGLDSDGNVGPKTLAALNIDLAKRIEQIRVNMERWRWLPQEFGNYYIKVNIASFELEVVRNDEVQRTFKVMTGKPYRQTPVMSSKVQYLVLNPTWTVPPGILNKDILPAVQKDPSYLAKKKLQVLDAKGNVLDPATLDWKSNAVRGYTYRQPAGPDNALGAVKFIFPNSFNVYIHDTPSKDLFNQTSRAFSSGCIRVDQPLELAQLLLNEASWTMDKINSVVKVGTTQTVHLKEQPNVHLLYWTAWSEAGVVQFRDDVYARDKSVWEGLVQRPSSSN